MMAPGLAAQLACILEATARKAGNVHRFADFDDVTYLDFILSAAAVAGPIGRARELGIGRAVLGAVEATRTLVGSNTNLGIILLLAPLAAIRDDEHPRAGAARVLEATTVEDARLVYAAIRRSGAGGLGEAAEQDVGGEPTVHLVAAMRLAADRDLVARQYAENYADVFDLALPTLREQIDAGRPVERAIVATHLAILAERPDTLIARKRGVEVAAEASRRAAAVRNAGPAEFAEFDATSADLVTAALFLALRDGTIDPGATLARLGWSSNPAMP
jgi:triphosphoribosyl-dephospho-CoA synthase